MQKQKILKVLQKKNSLIKKWILLSLGFILLLFVASLLLLNKSTKNISVPSYQVVTKPSGLDNNYCAKEGTAESATITEKYNLVSLLSPEFTSWRDEAAKNWEQDAYLIAYIRAQDLAENVPYNGGPKGFENAFIYASKCTTNFLVYNDFDDNQSISNDIHPKIQTKDSLLKQRYGYALNILQFPYNQVLPSSVFDKELPDFVVSPYGYFDGPLITQIGMGYDDKGNPIPGKPDIAVGVHTFHADRYAIQVNNSKKYGMLYDVTFFDNSLKRVALLSITSAGKLLSFTQ